MPNSFSYATELACPNCRGRNKFAVWLVVDVDERPDLAKHAHALKIHEFICGSCEHAFEIGAPLVIYSANHDPAVIASPTSQDVQEELRPLIGILMQQIPELDMSRIGVVQDRTALPHVLAEFIVPAPPKELADELYAIHRVEATGTQEAVLNVPERWTALINNPCFDTASCKFQANTLNDGGNAYLDRFRLTANPSDLSRSLQYLNSARDISDLDNPELPMYLNNLATCKHNLARETQDISGLLECIETHRDSIAKTPLWSPDRPRSVNNYCTALLDLGAWTNDIDEIQHAIDLLEEIASPRPGRFSAPDLALPNLVLAHQSLYKIDWKIEVIDEAIELARFVISNINDGANSYRILGQILSDRYRTLGESTDLNESISAFQEGLKRADARTHIDLMADVASVLADRYLLTKNESDRTECERLFSDAIKKSENSVISGNFAIRLRDFYQLTGNRAFLAKGLAVATRGANISQCTHVDNWRILLCQAIILLDMHAIGEEGALDRAIDLLEFAEASVAINDPRRHELLHTQAGALQSRFERDHTLVDLSKCIDKARESFTTLAESHPSWSMSLGNLISGLRQRLRIDGDGAELDEIVLQFHQSLDRMPKNDKTYPMLLSQAATCHFDRFEVLGNKLDLNTAIDLERKALSATNPTSPNYNSIQQGLAIYLRTAANRFGIEDALEECLNICHNALKAYTPNDRRRAQFLGILGNALCDIFESTGDHQLLKDSINRLQEAVDIAPSHEMPNAMGNLSISLYSDFENTSNIESLERAIELSEQAVNMTHDNSTNKPICLRHYAHGLHLRSQHTGQIADLERCIAVERRVVELTPRHAPSQLLNLYNLATSIWSLTEKTGDSKLLEEAVSVSRDAHNLAPSGSKDKLRMLGNLANTLLAKYNQTGDLKALNESIECFEELWNAGPQKSILLSDYTVNYFNALAARSNKDKRAQDLDYAIHLLDNAANTFLSSSRRTLELQVCLASGLQQRAELNKRLVDRDVEQAMGIYCELAPALKHFPDIALVAASNWGRLSMKTEAWEDGKIAHTIGLSAADCLYKMQLRRSHREAWLRSVQGLASGAAYVYAKLGDLESSVEHLEHWRARMLSDSMSRDSTMLSQLKQSEPSLFKEYDTLIQKINLFDSFDDSGLDYEAAKTTWERLDNVVGEIRNLDTYSDFLLMPRFAILNSTATAKCPVAYMCSQESGSMIILLDGGTPRVYWSSEFTSDSVNSHLIGTPEKRGLLTANRREIDAVISDIIRDLAQNLVHELADTLCSSDADQLTIIAAGRLSQLPIHAAANRRSDGRWITSFGRIAVRYAPSIRVLRVSQQAANHRNLLDSFKFLGIGNPLPNIKPIPYSAVEVRAVAHLFSDDSVVQCEEEATRLNLESELGGSNILHFSCHGTFDHGDARNTGLSLSGNDRLTLTDLKAPEFKRLTQHVRLAVLSACESAVSETLKLPDELISLPSAFLETGIPSVVGTLWSVFDLSTAIIMSKFYNYYQKQGHEAESRTSRALSHAVAWVRERTAHELADYISSESSVFSNWPPSERREVIERLTQYNPGQRPFESPQVWAGFVSYGA